MRGGVRGRVRGGEYYNSSIELSLPSLLLVSCSQTAAKAVRLHETSLNHCSAHSSKIDRTFDHELHYSANNIDTN